MLVSELISKINSNYYDDLLLDLYKDSKLLSYQKERYLNLLNEHLNLYGDSDVSIVSVAGRSEVCGNHTDHQHGQVLAASINLDTVSIVSKCNDIVRIKSDNYNIKDINLNDLEKREEEIGTSEALIRGILYYLKSNGYNINGFNATITSDVLSGSGLSSSAAFEGVIGTIISVLYNEMNIDPVVIAMVGQFAEREYFGKPCGLMDQIACVFGGLVNIDFENINEPKINKLSVDFSKYGYSVCIVDTKGSHADLGDDYASIPQELKQICNYFGKDYLREIDYSDFIKERPNLRKKFGCRAVLRAMHVYEENLRVMKAVNALNNDDFEEFKRVIMQSGISSYEFLQNVNSSKGNSFGQNLAYALGVSRVFLGENGEKGVSRVHGGGFAGTILAFVSNDYIDEYKEMMDLEFGKDSCKVLQIRDKGAVKVNFDEYKKVR